MSTIDRNHASLLPSIFLPANFKADFRHSECRNEAAVCVRMHTIAMGVAVGSLCHAISLLQPTFSVCLSVSFVRNMYVANGRGPPRSRAPPRQL